MSGLILKDMYVLVKQLGLVLLVTPLFMLSGEITAMFFTIILFSSLPMTAIGYDEQSKWTNYATMMPYSKNQLVVSKYLLGYLCITVAIVLSVAIHIIINLVDFSAINSSLDLNNLVLCISGALMFMSLHMFVNLKIGVEKGRIIYILGFVAVGALNGFIKSLGTNDIMKVLETPPIVFLGIAVLMNVVSILLSIKFRKKE